MSTFTPKKGIRGASKMPHSERKGYIHIGMTNGTLIALDELVTKGVSRSALIERAVKAHYKIGG